MAASKPTSQLSQHVHILRYTKPPLRGLSRRSGFFPSRRPTLSRADCLPGSIRQAFGVWLGEVRLRRPDPSSALPPADSFPEAVPKYVSGRTSYLRACLAFHPYPQVIRAVFNPHRFGPPRPVTAASTCPRVDRHGFGSAASNVIALFRLAFATAPALRALTCC